jgi:N-acetyl-anhydromuramyl-L-alanine amidase AmpD
MREIKYIILHHSATAPTLNDSDTDGSALAKIICRRAQAHWEKEFPTYRCDYHFLIGQGGAVFKWQPVTLPAWHATNYKVNVHSIGICFMGNFQAGIMKRAQFESGVTLVRKLMHLYSVSLKNVLRHRDVVSDITHRANSTLCPGKNFPYLKMLSALSEPVFKDLSPAYPYYKEVEFLKKHGIIKGSNGKFLPDELATREEVSLIAYRILKHILN